MIRPTTAERMRARMASLHIFPPLATREHMPFPGHRRLSEIGNKRDREDRERALRRCG